ncbi:MAG: hypothetical protein JW727_03730 [Candidatus Aenigmarchaeota archaeon]|nr:hypothetical protein [Candidatus Aenigmarchaeota archaeon]
MRTSQQEALVGILEEIGKGDLTEILENRKFESVEIGLQLPISKEDEVFLGKVKQHYDLPGTFNCTTKYTPRMDPEIEKVMNEGNHWINEKQMLPFAYLYCDLPFSAESGLRHIVGIGDKNRTDLTELTHLYNRHIKPDETNKPLSAEIYYYSHIWDREEWKDKHPEAVKMVPRLVGGLLDDGYEPRKIDIRLRPRGSMHLNEGGEMILEDYGESRKPKPHVAFLGDIVLPGMLKKSRGGGVKSNIPKLVAQYNMPTTAYKIT